ncbi:MAG TPA: excinuclease ABC subunit UvrC [Mycobacteriales bacterium]|jgi:excinuclease ABC subunit C|nr:excinuclease ABC subunit UvrC [Mycobacteriales bacterium]
MAHPASYRPAPGTIPDAPGVYKFRDRDGRVIYVGKAKSLRSRLSSYFQDVRNLHQRTRTMVETGASVEWTVVSTEVEALQLEYNWIKEFDPRFNVRYRDDKSYPSLAITFDDEYPRAMVMRGPKKRGVRYFGPYAHAWAIRETLDLLLRVFPVRTCSAGVFKRAGQVGRPCLLGYIGKCSAPCVGRVDADEHRRLAEELADFLAGQTERHLKRLEREMAAASAALEFERAARLRDDIGALRRAIEKQAVVLPGGVDADVVGLTEDPLEAAFQVFHVRDGRVRGQRGWVVDRVEELDTPDLVSSFVEQLYGSATAEDVPREVLVPALPPNADALADWLSGIRGARVSLRVPERGDKRALQETVTRNAAHAFQLHKLRRAGDLSARSKALGEIQDALGLPDAPLRIECFDISNLQGTSVVGSMVVFEDGLARKSEYRRFSVRHVEGQDDVGAMYEVIHRRFARYTDERDAPPPREEEGERRRFAYPPNLVVVDGGPPQVAAAARAMDELGVVDVSLCGLAKRLEEVWLPDRDEPVILPRTSEGLYLLQRVRDEAHRFAIAYHRQKRSRSMTTSALDTVPGLGETRRKALLKHFGSVKRLRAATPEEIAEVPGIGPKTAVTVAAALAATAPAPAVDPATGEILEPADT